MSGGSPLNRISYKYANGITLEIKYNPTNPNKRFICFLVPTQRIHWYALASVVNSLWVKKGSTLILPRIMDLESYGHQRDHFWPSSGKHILAHFDDETIVVYQAFKPSISDYAVRHQKFGGNDYSTTRMTWIKTNFLWMMYRSGWATKKDQERILAIRLSRQGFEEILRNAYTPWREKAEGKKREDVCVRLQWDPDHDPKGSPLSRKAIQLGIKGEFVDYFNSKWIQRISDVTELVHEQSRHVSSGNLNSLQVPSERVYIPADASISSIIELSTN